MKNTLKNAIVLDEDDFHPEDLGTDLVILERKRGVAVEIKHASIHRTSKVTGNKEHLRVDLKMNVGKAMRQLARFKNKSHGDQRLLSVQKWEYLVVTYDSLSWANSYNKSHALASVPLTMKEFARNVHVISIDELEYFLAFAQSAGLAKSLEEKREDEEDFEVDFGEYMDKPGLDNIFNSYLDEITKLFFEKTEASLKFD
jgi:hypothetical protein